MSSGMVVGLGSGTTMVEVVRILGRSRVRSTFIPASDFISRAARRFGLRLSTLEAHPELDLHLDGADEVDRRFRMIKGRGGALLREKILAEAARRVVIVVDRTKLVQRLGERSALPVEVLPFATGLVRRRLEAYGEPVLRRLPNRRPYLTDNGNYIFDVQTGVIKNPEALEQRINAIPGVIENGIFTGLAHEVVVGHEGGVTVVRSTQEFQKLFRSLKG